MDDKIIVTNGAALTKKYGNTGVARIKKAIDALIVADGKRGIKSRLIYLDNAATMKKFKGKAVTVPSAPKDNKDAIDAIFRSADPEYLMILGAPDVVPHQDLKNTAFKPGGDEDECAYGDLPYACDAPYSRDIATFKGPTRVVGRLPDLTGASDPSHLIRLLSIAEKYKSNDVSDYSAYFGLSADSWRNSTETSLRDIFGNSASLVLSPPSTHKHPPKRLAPKAHFINCHGGLTDPQFYGQKGTKFPVSLKSTGIKDKITPGTVAAVECCFGAELYDSVTLELPLPISQHYLLQGAYGYFGSTTIAYGPAVGNGVADIITKEFLLAVFEGASLGRAALIARQKYIAQAGELDPIDLKTIGQFNLLGDPSIHPVKSAGATHVPKGVDVSEVARIDRQGRRAKLKVQGQMLRETKPTASQKLRDVKKPPTVQKALANIAREVGIKTDEFMAFKVKAPKTALAKATKSAPVASRYYIAVYQPEPTVPGSGPPKSRAAVAKEIDGRIVEYRIYEGKSWAPIAADRKGSTA
ncbi:MAG: hypothetical protein JNM20_06440 [Rhizobiales bacterium]|nr:hypothetical protein [Hyphomicrobiales bacterium]